MMVHETAQSCYLINRFSQLLKLETMEVEERVFIACYFILLEAQPEMKNDWEH